MGDLLGALPAFGKPAARIVWKSHKQRQGLPQDIAFLRKEQREIKRLISSIEYLQRQRQPLGIVLDYGFVTDLREIDSRISTCLDVYDTAAPASDGDHGRPEPSRSSVHDAIRRARTIGMRNKLVKEIKKIKRLIVEAEERLVRRAALEAAQPVRTTTPITTAAWFDDHEAQPVGFDAYTRELVDLLAPGVAQKRVVAVTGPPGSGKTRLVKVAYDGVREQFECSAWVRASGLDEEGMLRDILRQTGAQVQDDAAEAQLLSQQLRQHLQDTRYIVVIDEMQNNNWRVVQAALPDNNTNSRVVMIVGNQGIIRLQWHRSCHVYNVQPLERQHSKNLLLQRAFGEDGCPYLGEGLDKILKECGDLPLAILSMAEYLRTLPVLNETACESICRNLGHILFTNDAFSRMKQVLSRTYDSLPDLAQGCAMSLGECSKDQQVLEREALTRRWVDGKVVTQCTADNQPYEEIVDQQFDILVDHNIIIQPIDVGNDGKVNTCRVQPMMHVYIRHTAARGNYTTFIHRDHKGHERLPKSGDIRRLFYHSSIADDPSRMGMEFNLSDVQSATISGHAGNVLSALSDSENLQELNLENCSDLKNDSLKFREGSKLRNLRIKGKSVTKLPKKTEKLRRLVTLDIRGTNVDTLPIQVTQLPNLTVLVGRFGVPCKGGKRKFRKLQKRYKKSKLQTIAGLYVDGSVAFLACLPHMPKLNELKLCCRHNAEDGDFNPEILASSIEDCAGISSLSIDFGNVYPLDFLQDINCGSFCLLISLELRGHLSKFPSFISNLDKLNHLCLSETGLGLDALFEVAKMPALSRLKLVEINPDLFMEGEFVIESGQFPGLQHLSIAAPRLPKIVIRSGALPGLHTLELFCTESDGISGLQHLTRLKELVLDANASEDTSTILSQEASMHPMKPRIIKK